MGIYDREYVRDARQTPPRGFVRRFSFVSVNTWLILINIAVFVLGFYVLLPALGATAVDFGRIYFEELTPEQQSSLVVDRRVVEGPNRFGTPYRPIFHQRTDPQTGQIEQVPVGVQRIIFMEPLHAWGHFSSGKLITRLEVWRFITFQFLHANLMHLAFNMLGLFIFGGIVEQYLGRKRYLAFYLVTGIFGALLYLLLNLFGHIASTFGLPTVPGLLFNDVYTPLVGASAGVFGVIVACAFIAPNNIVYLIFPPIPLKMKFLAYGYVVLALVQLLTGSANADGEAAHLGGAVAGYFFIRRAHLLRDFFDILGDSRAPGRKKRPRQPRPPREPKNRPDPREVDRIFEKIRREGLASLSNAEREILRRERLALARRR